MHTEQRKRTQYSIEVFSFLLPLLCSIIAMGCVDCNGSNNEYQSGETKIGITAPYWTEIDTSMAPHFRGNTCAAYDYNRKVVVMFGGSSRESGEWTVYDDTWEFDGQNWEEKTFSIHPEPRARGGMCYCGSWNSIILFGGENITKMYNDTWMYDENGWSLLDPPTKPSKRSSMGMEFDKNLNKVILFSGEEGNGNLPQDCWTFDGNTWEKLDLPAIPPPRVNPGFVYDRARDKIVLFGGFVSIYQVYTDTWEFDGLGWQKVETDTKPSVRFFPGMIYYDLIKKTVLFGGSQLLGSSVNYLNDTWEFDGVDWIEVFPTTKPPEGRAGMLFEYSDKNKQGVMFGGWDEDSFFLNDTWIYSVVAPKDGPMLSTIGATGLIFLFSILLFRKIGS